MIEHSQELKDLAAALAKAQGQVTGAVKDSTNPHFNRKYADLASVWDALRKPFADNGLSIVHMPGFSDTAIVLETMLLHESGQWMRGMLSMPFEVEKGRNAAQSIGSAITYMRRYVDSALAAVCPEDDDGNTSGAAATETHRPEVRRPQGVDENGVIKMPGDATKWDGHGGKPLTDLSIPMKTLENAKKWMEKTDPTAFGLLINGIRQELERRIILEDEKRTTDVVDEAGELLAPAPRKAAPAGAR